MKKDKMIGSIEMDGATAHLCYPQCIPPSDRGSCREITELYVPKELRGEGRAIRLMLEIAEQADHNCLVLLISPSPFSDGLLSKQQLIDFYAKLDYVTVQDGDFTLMARQNGKR